MDVGIRLEANKPFLRSIWLSFSGRIASPLKRPNHAHTRPLCAAFGGPNGGGGVGVGSPLILALLFAIPEGMSGQALSVQLDPSDHNGFAISCFGGRDGSIDLTVSGGTPPYTYEWSTGANTQDISGVAAGYYRVAVYDSDTGYVEREITLGEPELLVGTATAIEYPNDFNVSCHSCYNGSIDASAAGGVAPYTYAWRDGAVVEARSGLGARDYTVTVSDANGCEAAPVTLTLREPQRNDWTMNGNAGTDPATHYIGSSDNKDVVFRSNGIERLRLLGNGQLKLTGLGDGILKSSGGGLIEALPIQESLMPYDLYPFWRTDGNYLATTLGHQAFLGSKDNTSLWIKTNNTLRMIISNGGRAALGEDIDQHPMAGALTIKTGWNDWLTLRRRTADPDDDGFWHIHNCGPEFNRLKFYYTDKDGIDAVDGNLTLWNNGKVSIGQLDINTPVEHMFYVGGSIKGEAMVLGNVSSAAGYRLFVEDGIITEKLKVAIPSTEHWMDKVFDNDYRLISIAELRSYVSINCHLPGVPSAESVVTAGLDVAEFSAILLSKIEELTLYIIELNHEIENIKAIKSDSGENSLK